MTSGFLSRRLALLAALAASALLFGCGGGGGDGGGNTTMRAINLTTDVSSVDVFTNDTKQFSAVATNALTDNVTLSAASYSINVKRAGDGASLFTQSFSLAKDQHYTTIVWGREAAIRVSTLPEDENTNDITSGNARVRVFNATIDSGSLDVFLTSSGADLSDTAATQGALTSGTLAGFRDISAGSYRLRVTGAGDPTDVRLDIPVVTLADKQFVTLVLTATGNSGVLLNGTLIVQQGAKTSMQNTKARVRLVASMANSGVVTLSINGASPFGAYRSPRVAATYALVDSGSQNVTINVNNVPIAGNGPMTFATGADYTLMVWGREGQGKATLFTDDNRVPTTATRAKLRLVNGLATSDLLTLALDFQNFVATSDIAPGVASGYATPNVAGTSQVEVNSPSQLLPLFTRTASTNSTLLVGTGVYSVFILDGQTQPYGQLIRDR